MVTPPGRAAPRRGNASTSPSDRSDPAPTLASTLPVRTSADHRGRRPVARRRGWGAFQKVVHDNGFTGATVQFAAPSARQEPGRPASTRPARADLLRAAAARPDDGRDPRQHGRDRRRRAGRPGAGQLHDALHPGHDATRRWRRSTSSLNNIDESVFRFGVIARSLDRLRDRFVRLSRRGHRAARQLTGLRVRDDHRPAQGLPVSRSGQRLHDRQRRARARRPG